MHELESFFWQRVQKTDTCWVWIGGKHLFGYGLLGKKPRYNAHRYSWILHNGPISDPDICVLHKCDVPACVNPDHLFLGNRQDNMADCISKGRFNLSKYTSHPGEANANAKLTNEKVKEVRRLRSIGTSVKAIAKQIGVTVGCIENVLYGKTWKHVL